MKIKSFVGIMVVSLVTIFVANSTNAIQVTIPEIKTLIDIDFGKCTFEGLTKDFKLDAAVAELREHGGKTSLYIETNKKNSFIKFPKSGRLESWHYYLATVECEISDLYAKDIKVFFTAFDGRYSTLHFNPRNGKAIVKLFFPYGAGKGIVFRMDSAKPCKLRINRIKIESSSVPECAANWIFKKDIFKFMRLTPFSARSQLTLENPVLYMSENEFFPFIDKYGQYKHALDKSEHISSDADFAKRLADENEYLKKFCVQASRDIYGGIIDSRIKADATGRFYTKKINGKWFFITPDGNPFWSFGVTAVQRGTSIPSTYRENYFENLSDSRWIVKNQHSKSYAKDKPFEIYKFNDMNLYLKYGDDYMQKSAEQCVKRMRAWGLNTCGCWTERPMMKLQKIPYTLTLESVHDKMLNTSFLKPGGRKPWRKLPDFFDQSFEVNTMKKVATMAKLAKSSMCIGAFVDNEIWWQNTELKTPRAVLTTPSTQPAKIKFRRQLETKYTDIEKLNAIWKSDYKSWDDFLLRRDFSAPEKSAEPDLLAFETSYYERYFSICRKAVKSLSPDLLYLGSRFCMAFKNDLCIRVASKYCDTVSFNIYADSVAEQKLPKGAYDKPILVGEFNFGNVLGNQFNGVYPAWTMDAQIFAYENYAKSAIDNPAIIGIHWFRWIEQSVAARRDGENFVSGFVDGCDTPFRDMGITARRISDYMYMRRLSEK